MIFSPGLLLVLAAAASLPEGIPGPAPAPQSADAPGDIAPLAEEPALPGVVREVTIFGNVKTTRHVILRELGWHAGTAIDDHAWHLGLTRLQNTMLFNLIEAHRVEAGPGQFDAVIHVQENFTLYPSFNAVASSDIFWLSAGVSEFNLFGAFRELRAQYERYNDEHGGQIGYRDPRLFDERLDFSVVGGRFARPRPTFTLLRLFAQTELARLLNDDHLRVGLRAEVGHDEYTAAIDGTSASNTPSAYGILSAPTRLGRIDRFRVDFDGQSLEVTPSVIAGGGARGFFPSFSAAGLFYKQGPGRTNLAVRVLGGATGASTSNFRMYIGGLETVRGFPDSYANGTQYAAANIELRWTAFDSKYLAIQPAAFVDGAAMGNERQGHGRLLSAGAGVRFICPLFAQAGLRIDLAERLIGGSGLGLSVGAYQFFF